MGAATLTGRNTTNYIGSVFDHLACMKSSFRAGKSPAQLS